MATIGAMTASTLPPSGWRQQALLHWRMTRPAFLLVTVSAALVGIASAASCGCGFDLPAALATVLLACVAHAGANVLNELDKSDLDSVMDDLASAGATNIEAIRSQLFAFEDIEMKEASDKLLKLHRKQTAAAAA